MGASENIPGGAVPGTDSAGGGVDDWEALDSAAMAAAVSLAGVADALVTLVVTA